MLFGADPLDGASPSETGAPTDAQPPVDSTVDNDGSSGGPGDADPPRRDGGRTDAGGKDAGDAANPDATGSDAAPDSAESDGASDDASADTGTDAGMDAECGAAHRVFTNDAGPFCPFTATGPANCAVTEHCCEYRADAGFPSTCNGANAACVVSPGVIDWGCDEQNDCPTSQVCCFIGAIVQDRPECPVYRGVGVSGTVCRPGACNAGETVACGAQADCTSGTCLGLNVRGKNLGFCQ